jgi:acyl-coenzyme A thioesterase PaaI-like protein
METPRAAQLLGMSIVDVDRRRGIVRAEFDVRIGFVDRDKRVRDGFVAAFLDECICAALRLPEATEPGWKLANLNVTYFSSAEPGKLTGVGRLVAFESGVWFVESELFQVDAKIASALATAHKT